MLVAKRVDGKKHDALRVLRQHAGFTMKEIGSRFHRRASAVAGWESGDHWPPGNMPLRMLQSMGFPTDLLARHFSVELDDDLDSRAYLHGDPIEIEWMYLLRHRGKVLQSLTQRAEEGSTQDAKLFKDWMSDIESRQAKRDMSSPRILNGTRSSWTTKALAAHKPNVDSDTATGSDELPTNEAVDGK